MTKPALPSSPSTVPARAPSAPRRRTAASERQALAELASWIERGELPEITPTRQERSLKSTLAMLEAGRALLADRSLEDLAIEAVCAGAGTTVGAFYGRFESKIGFFRTLQRVQTIRSQADLAEFAALHGHTKGSLDDLCVAIVRLTVLNFQQNVGVLRASLQHSREGMWQVFKESGDRFRVILVERLAPHLTSLPPKTRRLRILFAYEAMAGVLVHATLNNPGPLGIDDVELPRELVRLFKAYLLAPDAA